MTAKVWGAGRRRRGPNLRDVQKRARWHPAVHTGMEGVTGSGAHGTRPCDNDKCRHEKHYTRA